MFRILLLALFLAMTPIPAPAGTGWSTLESVIEQQLTDPGLRPAKLAAAVPTHLRDAAWTIGVEAGLAKHCGLDWQATRTAPMMAIARQSGRLDRAQLKALSSWTGVAQRNAFKAADALGPCTDDLLAWLKQRGISSASMEPISG